MSLKVGNAQVTEGMAAAIYDSLHEILEPYLTEEKQPEEMEDAVWERDVIEPLRESWQQLSYAVAAGVVRYLLRDPPSDDPDFAEEWPQTEYAETSSTAVEDEEFWTWLQGFTEVFTKDWVPMSQDGGAALKSAMASYLASKPVPTRLKGIVE